MTIASILKIALVSAVVTSGVISAHAKDIYVAPKSYKITICNTDDKIRKCIIIDLAKARTCRLYPKYCDID
jgi:hypothetical protein